MANGKTSFLRKLRVWSSFQLWYLKDLTLPAMNPAHLGNKLRNYMEWTLGGAAFVVAGSKTIPAEGSMASMSALGQSAIIPVLATVATLPAARALREKLAVSHAKFLRHKVDQIPRLQAQRLACEYDTARFAQERKVTPNPNLYVDVFDGIRMISRHLHLTLARMIEVTDDRDVAVIVASAHLEPDPADNNLMNVKVSQVMVSSRGVNPRPQTIEKCLVESGSKLVGSLQNGQEFLEIVPDMRRDQIRTSALSTCMNETSGSMLWYTVAKADGLSESQLLLVIRCEESRKFRASDSEWYRDEVRYYGEKMADLAVELEKIPRS